MTYGDSAADVNVKELVAFHQAHGKLATMTAVQPPGRFGAIDLAEDGESAVGFREKPRGNDIWVDGGFFVLKPRVLDRVAGDDMALEREPLETVALGGQSSAHPDSGLGQAMDVLRDKIALKEPCRSGSPPWRVW